MRKQLLAGTALVAATMLVAGGAVAADKKMMKPSISVNGYYEGVVGGIFDEDNDTAAGMADTTAIDTRTDAEIHFNGRGTTENGMKVHVRVELEGQNNHSDGGSGDDPIDEYFVSVSGSFGKIILGGTGGAPVKMLTGLSGSWATGVGESLSFDDAWVPSASGNFHELRHSRLDSGDAEKVTYISPKFGGFSVGATYSPNRVNNDSNARIDTSAAGYYDGFELAASYGGKFGDVGFGLGAGMTNYQSADAAGAMDWSDWLVAARLDFGGGFRVSGAYKQTNDPLEATIVDLGVRYVVGANSFSLAGMHGQRGESGNDAYHTKVMASYARAMGPGVKVHLNALWNESANADESMENTGTALITGIRVSF